MKMIGERPQTMAEKNANRKARQKALGRNELQIFAHTEDNKFIRAFAEFLCLCREGEINVDIDKVDDQGIMEEFLKHRTD